MVRLSRGAALSGMLVTLRMGAVRQAETASVVAMIATSAAHVEANVFSLQKV
jgi:hypothetical protein